MELGVVEWLTLAAMAAVLCGIVAIEMALTGIGTLRGWWRKQMGASAALWRAARR